MKKLHVLCITLLTAGVTMAGLFDPAYRGDDNSVHAIFENPLGGTGTPLVPLGLTIFETGPSSYPLAGQLSAHYDGFLTFIDLPNFVDELPMKKIRIQMEFLFPVSGEDLMVGVNGHDPLPVTWSQVGGSNPFVPALEHYIDIEMFPNPDWESFTILNEFDITNAPRVIEIDTISIPEPASLGLLGLISGGIYFTRRFFIA